MDFAEKQQLSERDICRIFISPAIERAGWNRTSQIREEVYITKGRVLVSREGVRRANPKWADYILYYKPNIPVAVVEAKNNKHGVGDGMQQALEYAEMLDVPFVYSSNGDAFLEHDRSLNSGQIEREIPLDSFPTPHDIWEKYCEWKGIDEEHQKQIVNQDYYPSFAGKTPRYYQINAINRVVEAVAKGRDRLLLVMATGTGKTYTAFQIIWRLWKSKTMKRILFLADRNILVDQAKTNDFKPFESAMTKIKNREVDKSYEIYLSLYQAVTGNEEDKNIYKQFSPDFFDLVVVDECHRGSAAENSAWREILEYFSSATQIGLTATPKESREISNIDYFGEPIYTYSLKQGIEDGFLAPYRVRRIDFDRDLEGWRPERGQIDKYGYEIEDRIYNQKEFDRSLVLEERVKQVAKNVSSFLKKTERFSKTIVFCEDVDHAERMRQALVNENADLIAENSKYVVRITGDEPYAAANLDDFIIPENKYPVIATTSRLLNTGVDVQTCKLIVLDKRIQSMTEFKQIIGRGTRINEDFNKYFFTIMDFRKATELFADPEFDGEPIQESTFEMPSGYGNKSGQSQEEQKSHKYVVGDVSVEVLAERIQYYDQSGKLVTESLKDYTRKTVAQQYGTIDEFLNEWSEAERKQQIIEELEEEGVLFDELEKQIGKEMDAFDLICHVAFDKPPLSRRERADKVRNSDYFTKYGDNARKVLSAMLDKYADEGIENIENMEVLRLRPFDNMGTPFEILDYFGGKQGYKDALKDLEAQIYEAEV